jgi:hypothetical protein
MFHKFVSLILTSALLSLTAVTPVAAQKQRETVARMKQTAQKAMAKDKEITAVLKHSRSGKKKFKGKVKQITDDGLTLTDVKTGEQTQFAFDEIQEIRVKASHTGLIVGLAVIAGVAVAVFVVLAKITSD